MAGSTPIYGFPYPQSTDLVADYPTLGQELATDVETVISGLKSGLNLMNPSSLANSGGTATKSTGGLVTFTGVNSVSLNGVFTSNYLYYRVMIRCVASAASEADLRLRVSGTDAATNYSRQVFTAYSGSSSLAFQETSQTIARCAVTSSNGGWATIDVFGPQTATQTGLLSLTCKEGTTANSINMIGANHSTATSYDGITFLPNIAQGGTITGTVAVFGYAQ